MKRAIMQIAFCISTFTRVEAAAGGVEAPRQMGLLHLTINLCGIRTSATSSNDYPQKLTQFPPDTRTESCPAGFHRLVLYLKRNRAALEQVGEPEMILSLWLLQPGPAQIKRV